MWAGLAPNGRVEKIVQGLYGKRDAKRPRRRRSCRWEDNIKMYRREWDRMYWIGTSCGLLFTWQLTVGFRNMWGLPLNSELLSACQE